MWLLPEVIRVDSLTNYNWVHAEGDDIIVEPLIPEEESFNLSFLRSSIKILFPLNYKDKKRTCQASPFDTM